MLSRFVYETVSNNKPVLFHSVTRKELDPSSDLKTLEDNLFLESQNHEAIRSRLTKPPEHLEITFIPTWECNLRCNHCCVLHLLKKKDEDSLDLAKVEDFLDRYYTKYKLKDLQCTLLGGEPLLYPEKVTPLLDICERIEQKHSTNLFTATTTNLAYDLTLAHIRILERLDFVGVSIDGLIDHHNKQRFFYRSAEKNPFQKTVKNLQKLVKLGLAEKLLVQAAINEDILNPQYSMDFIKFIMSLGLKLNQVKIGSIFPTKYKPEPQSPWFGFRTNNIFLKSAPCCKYELMSRIQVHPNGTLWDNFYTQESSNLGTLDSTLEEIESRNVDLIMNHMPAMKDEECRSCPALGYCWGGCVAGLTVLDKKPSEICSKHLLVPFMKKLAEENRLIDYKVAPVYI